MFYQPGQSNAANIAAAVGQGYGGSVGRQPQFNSRALPFSRSSEDAAMFTAGQAPWANDGAIMGSFYNTDLTGMYSMANNAIEQEATARAWEDRWDTEERVAKINAEAQKYQADKQLQASRPKRNTLGGIGSILTGGLTAMAGLGWKPFG